MKKALLLFAAIASAASAWAAAPVVSRVEARRMMLLNQVLFVDVRGPDDFVKGHIQGARNIPAAGITRVTLPRDREIIVYCGEYPCALTTGAADALLNAGYTQVGILEGGITAWIGDGYPAVKGTGAPPKPRIPKLPAKEAHGLMDSGRLLVLDVRPGAEFAAGHLPGARNIPVEELSAALTSLPKDQPVLFYDRTALRGRQAGDKLASAGIKASELSGGVAGWIKAGYPLEMKKGNAK